MRSLGIRNEGLHAIIVMVFFCGGGGGLVVDGGGLVVGVGSVYGEWDGVSTGDGFQRNYANLTP